jgi:glycosyltransferase involved in cell wall biosynthesis
LVCWYYSPMALAFSAHLEPQLCVYDCMDELSGFRGAPASLRKFERQLFSVADVVFTGGVSLYEAKRGQHRNVHAFPSSIDAAHFAQAREGGLDPADQVKIARPRIGFFGVVDERMDVELLAEVADLRPDWQVVVIGPVVKIDPATLPRRSNIHWLGKKSYAELPDYLRGWSVGIMPFAINEATHFISPTKTPEFLAAGLPVVSTPITDVVRTYGDQGLVEIAGTATEFVSKIADLMVRPKGEWRARVDAKLGPTSWDRTWHNMAVLMQSAMPRRAQPRSVSADVNKVSVGGLGVL